MKEITIKNSFWVLKVDTRYISPTHSEWGPAYLPDEDIHSAERFISPIEAMEFARGPGRGWEDAKPIQVDTITKYTYSEL